MSDAAVLLEVVRDAAARGEDLGVALRASGVPGATLVAERLAAGETLPRAVAGLVPPRLAEMLASSTPPLATVAALLADEAWREEERRRLIADHLAYPVASLALVAGIGLALARFAPHGPWYAPLVSAGWAALPAALFALVALAPWLPRRWRAPGSGWARHLDLAARWARAALSVRWRLTEAQALRLLGANLAPLAHVLGAPGAEAHCRMLADWHRRAARRRLALTARAAAALVLATGGGLVLASARLWAAAPV